MSSAAVASRFGQRLAHTEKKYRDQALKKLTAYLGRKHEWSPLEWDKLWKALFYCMWMSDKRPVQMELARNLARLVHKIPARRDALGFVRSFFRTMHREWHGLDGLRLDKFYDLVRQFVRESVALLAAHKFARAGVSELVEILSAEVVSQRPNGLRMHLADLYLAEICGAAGETIETGALLLLLEPFFTLLGSEYDQSVFKRVRDLVFLPMLSEFLFGEAAKKAAKKKKGDDETDGDDDDEEEAAPRGFPRVDLARVQHRIFAIAAAEDTAERNRAALYDLYGKFAALTEVDSLKVAQEEALTPSKDEEVEEEEEDAEMEEAAATEAAPEDKQKKKKKNKKRKQADALEQEQQKEEEAEVKATEAASPSKKQKKAKKQAEEAKEPVEAATLSQKEATPEKKKKAKKVKKQAEEPAETPAEKQKQSEKEEAPATDKPKKKKAKKNTETEPVADSKPAEKKVKESEKEVEKEVEKKAKKEKKVEKKVDEPTEKKAAKEDKAEQKPREEKKKKPAVVVKSGVKFQRCASCGGFGKNLLRAGKDMCGHCERSKKTQKKAAAKKRKAEDQRAAEDAEAISAASAKKVTFGKNKALPHNLSVKRLKASAKKDAVPKDADIKSVLKASVTPPTAAKKSKKQQRKTAADFF